MPTFPPKLGILLEPLDLFEDDLDPSLRKAEIMRYHNGEDLDYGLMDWKN